MSTVTNVNKSLYTKYQVVTKSNNVDKDKMSYFDESINTVTMDLQNRVVSLNIIEYDYYDFYQMLNNLLADKNITMLIRSTKVYRVTDTPQIKFPYFYFEVGQVISHQTSNNLTYNIPMHTLSFKFNRFNYRSENVPGFF